MPITSTHNFNGYLCDIFHISGTAGGVNTHTITHDLGVIPFMVLFTPRTVEGVDAKWRLVSKSINNIVIERTPPTGGENGGGGNHPGGGGNPGGGDTGDTQVDVIIMGGHSMMR